MNDKLSKRERTAIKLLQDMEKTVTGKITLTTKKWIDRKNEILQKYKDSLK